MFHFIPLSDKAKSKSVDIKRAITIGGFDGVHLGHQAIIGKLIAAANSRSKISSLMIVEPQAREYFEKLYNLPPIPRIMSLSQKIAKINYLQKQNPRAPMLDEIIVANFNQKFANITAAEFVKIMQDRLKVKYWLLGADFHFGKNRQGNFQYLQEHKEEHHIELFALENINDEYNQRYSSTLIRKAISNGDFTYAKIALGEDYSIIGKVQYGEKLGEKLSFPTANLHFKYPPPLSGVYAAFCEIFSENINYPAVINVGKRPTVDDKGIIKLEAHLLISAEKFSNINLYGKKIKVKIIKKIREEKKFANLSELKNQIAKDIEQAKIATNYNN